MKAIRELGNRVTSIEARLQAFESVLSQLEAKDKRLERQIEVLGSLLGDFIDDVKELKGRDG